MMFSLSASASLYAVLLLLAVVVLNFFADAARTRRRGRHDRAEHGRRGCRDDGRASVRTTGSTSRSRQLGVYVWGVLQGDLGYSFFFNLPVTELLLERSARDAASGDHGAAPGARRRRLPRRDRGATARTVSLSHFVTLLALFGYSAPVFWTGIMLLIAFSLMVPLFPVAGMADVTVTGGWWVQALDVAHHLVLPAITLASIFLALYSRLCRASMLEVLGSDYIRTAKAKGLSEGQVVDQACAQERRSRRSSRWRGCSSPPSSPAPCWSRRCSPGPDSERWRCNPSSRGTRRPSSASCSSPR